MSDIEVRENGRKNGQITDRVKRLLADWFEERGVSSVRRDVVFHHYNEGEFVAVSDFGVSNRRAFNEACSALIDDHPENRRTADDCVWVSRAWLRKKLADRAR